MADMIRGDSNLNEPLPTMYCLSQFQINISVMLTKNIEFEDNIDSLTGRKMKALSMRAKNPGRFKDLEEVEKIFMKKGDQHKTDQLFS